MTIPIAENLRNLALVVYGEDERIGKIADALRPVLRDGYSRMFCPSKVLSKLTAKRLNGRLNISPTVMTDNCLWSSREDPLDHNKMIRIDRLLSPDMLGERTSSVVFVTTKELADYCVERLRRLNHSLETTTNIKEGQAYLVDVKTGEMSVLPS